LYTFYHNHATEIVGFFTGGSAGIVSYIHWQDNLIAVGLAFLTGFIGAAGATTWKYFHSKLKK